MLVSLTDQAVVTHTFSSSGHTSCHRNQVMHALVPVVHAFQPSPREEYKTGGDSSQTQSHSEIPGDKIAISD